MGGTIAAKADATNLEIDSLLAFWLDTELFQIKRDTKADPRRNNSWNSASLSPFDRLSSIHSSFFPGRSGI
jgi:hypothetical protein